MEDKIFKNDAKTIVDMFFNTKIFKDNITRDDMNATEEFIESVLRSRFESYQKCEKLMESLKKTI